MVAREVMARTGAAREAVIDLASPDSIAWFSTLGFDQDDQAALIPRLTGLSKFNDREKELLSAIFLISVELINDDRGCASCEKVGTCALRKALEEEFYGDDSGQESEDDQWTY